MIHLAVVGLQAVVRRFRRGAMARDDHVCLVRQLALLTRDDVADVESPRLVIGLVILAPSRGTTRMAVPRPGLDGETSTPSSRSGIMTVTTRSRESGSQGVLGSTGVVRPTSEFRRLARRRDSLSTITGLVPSGANNEEYRLVRLSEVHLLALFRRPQKNGLQVKMPISAGLRERRDSVMVFLFAISPNVAFSGALQRVRCKAGLDGFSYWLSRPTDFRCCCRACSKRNAVGRTSGR